MQIGISLGITGNRRAEGGASYSPNVLFAASEAGDWFDPSDLSRMWQDTAGTTPVTADGQTVARIDGQRGVVSLRQSDAAKRPAYKTSGGLHWLQFDGTNDFLASAANPNFSGSDEITLLAGITKPDETTSGHPISLRDGSLDGGASIQAPRQVSASPSGYDFIARGTTQGTARYDNAANVAPETIILTGTAKISTDTAILRKNGVQVAANVNDMGTGNFSSAHPLAIGARGDGGFRWFKGNVFFALARGALTSGADITALEGFAAAKTGVTI